jgi:hypothetical protein
MVIDFHQFASKGIGMFFFVFFLLRLGVPQAIILLIMATPSCGF